MAIYLSKARKKDSLADSGSFLQIVGCSIAAAVVGTAVHTEFSTGSVLAAKILFLFLFLLFQPINFSICGYYLMKWFQM